MDEGGARAAEKLPALFDPHQDLAPLNELQATQIREIALNGVETLQRTAIKMQEDSSEMGRWILASLLAINTGGVVATVSASEAVVGPVGEPIVAFAIGAVLAIGTGINAMVTAVRMGPVIGDVIERLRLSVFESTIHSATRLRVLDLIPILKQQVAISSSLAAGSIAAFGAGVWSAVT
ncbi:hypothetical protein [Porphyrobacter sp. CACIAM 03H1]|uniref:hypothetical protein n=1 Tax=Porphyrobacter sp. CACIAM 03H1 TaxID=2003315 RepID=UPI000B5A8B00|nr:hypothetical protein [Porphyrobacter sp. CACIAM 03H1]ASJ90263.1 hypothetical protein CBR61_04535 [Porphyrobacter sp. CACIAM 03H1]